MATNQAFPPTSRYHGLEMAELILPDGRTVAYVCRRLVPAPETLALLQEHAVVEDDRLDRLAARYLGDPEQFWRICDANRALWPADLTARIGRRLRITLPDGIPGVPTGLA